MLRLREKPFIAVGIYQAIKIWNTETGENTQTLAEAGRHIRCICEVQSDGTLVTGSSLLKTWKLTEKKATMKASTEGTEKEGEQLLEPGPHYELHLTLQGHTDLINGVIELSNSSRGLIASCSSDETIRLWDIRSGTPEPHRHLVKTLHTGQPQDVLVDMEGGIFASGSWKRSIWLWNHEGDKLYHYEAHVGIDHLIKLRDGSLLYSAGVSNSFYVTKTWIRFEMINTHYLLHSLV